MKMRVLGCKLHRVHLDPILWKDTREQITLDEFLFGETRLFTENKEYYCLFVKKKEQTTDTCYNVDEP